MAQLKDLIVNGPSRFIGDVYATTFTGDLNGNANTATSATTASALTGKTLVTASAVTTSNWPTYKDNHIPTMSFMAHWNGAYSGTSSNLTYCAQGTIIGSNNIGSQSVKYATTSGSCNGNAATATNADLLDGYHATNFTKTVFGAYSNSDDSMITCTDFATWISRLGSTGIISGFSSISTGAWWWTRSVNFQVNNWDIKTSGAMIIHSGDGDSSHKNHKHLLILDAYGDLYGITSNSDWEYYTKFVKTSDLPTSLPANGGNADTSNRTKFLETFAQNSTTNTYGSQYPIWAQWSDATNVRLRCTNYTVWTDKATYATTAGSAPASDVYSWAKQSTKPSYTGTEVTLTTDYTSSPYKPIDKGDSIQAAIAKLDGALSGLEALLASI